ncbi:hypothetical protein [Clostridium tagluense]|uniref:Uncharacterized protein n=1 Tax=Clostridium tagluense TaxID=360422 RepID=A0A401UT37_9CLOT|nr:hypothetical protein [Clostridium tagluense]GCD12618.1 hypothetical protein Ctaglu_42410 [Clostridium tagluense]
MKKALISLVIILGLGVVSIPVVYNHSYHVVTIGGECEDNCIENGFFAYADDSKGNRFFIELKGGEGTSIINSKYIVENIKGSEREVKKLIQLY